MYWKALASWFLLLVIAIANGAFREFVLVPRMTAPRPHQLSTILLSGAILLLSLAVIRWINPARTLDALRIGAMWLVLTLCFEFGFGRWQGKSWATLLEDYNLLVGRIWPLVLVVTLVAPWFAARIRGLLP